MRRTGRVAAWAVLLLSLAVLASVAVVRPDGEAAGTQGAAADVGSVPGPEPADIPPVRPRPAVRESVPVRRPATEQVGATAGVEVHDARLGEQRVDLVRPPVRIVVPALGIDAPVQSMGIEANGEMELPADPAAVGWYGYGPTPGEPGSSVVAGHVDGGGRPGPFFSLRRVAPGQRVTVLAGDGSSRQFRVVGRRVFVKERLPTPLIFRRTGRPVLTLVTCGGAFDRSTGHYESNVVVFATPV